MKKINYFLVFVGSYIFIMNNLNSQSIDENEKIKAKNNIKYILDKKDDDIKNNEINLGSFNAQFYTDYLGLYNYFNN